MSNKIDRLVVSRGPAVCYFAGGVFLSREDMVVELKHDTGSIDSDAFGKLTDMQLGVKASLKFRPIGEFEHLDVLWPHAATKKGQSIFGTEDSTLIIKPLDGTQKMVTFKAAGVSKMPDLNFTAKDTIIGDVEFKMVGANNTVITDAARLFVFADNDLDPEAIPYDPEKLLVQAYTNRWLEGMKFKLTFGANSTGWLAWDASAADIQTAYRALASVLALTTPPAITHTFAADGEIVITYGVADGNVAQVSCTLSDNAPSGTTLTPSTTTAGVTDTTAEVQKVTLASPWQSFEAREGVKVSFEMQTTDDETDAIGHYDTIFNSLDCTLKAQPQGISLENVLAAARVQGPLSVRGRKLATGALGLDVIGEGVYFRLYGANLDGAGITRSSKNQAVPELTWKGSRVIGAGGTVSPLFHLGTVAP
jgi:hypothetical protein